MYIPEVDDTAAVQWEMLEAAESGDRDHVALLIRAHPHSVAARGLEGRTPLHVAAARGHRDVLALLLDHGADPNASDDNGQTPLHSMVLWCTDTKVAELLLAHGAALDARDRDGSTPLALAAGCIHRSPFNWGDHGGLARYLLAKGAALDVFSAVILDLPARLDALLKANPQLVHLRDAGVRALPKGATPLHHAAERGYHEVVQVLLRHGAAVHALDGRGRTPLYLAAHSASTRKMRPSQAVVELLLAHGAPQDLFAAALLGRTDTLARLLAAAPAQVNAADAGGSTPLHLAAWTGQRATVELLLQRGAQLNAHNGRGETPLALATMYSYVPEVRQVIEVLCQHSAAPAHRAGGAALLPKDTQHLHRDSHYVKSPAGWAAPMVPTPTMYNGSNVDRWITPCLAPLTAPFYS